MACPLLFPVCSLVAGLILAGLLKLDFSAGPLLLLLAGWLAAWLAYFLKKDRLAYWLTATTWRPNGDSHPGS